MLQIDEFWRELLPMYTDFEFIYIFLNISTVLVLLTILFEVPSKILLGKKGGFMKWD